MKVNAQMFLKKSYKWAFTKKLKFQEQTVKNLSLILKTNG